MCLESTACLSQGVSGVYPPFVHASSADAFLTGEVLLLSSCNHPLFPAYLLSKVLRLNLKSSKKFIAHAFCSTEWNE